MKKLSKVLVLVLSAIMVLAMSASVFAAAGTPATGTITITPPDNATGTNTYKIYKVFDATVNAQTGAVAYKLLPDLADTDVPAGFTAVRGYITEAPSSLDETASALAAYDKKVLVDTVTTTGTTAGTSKSLDPGYYYIETSTGTAVYVEAGGNIEIKDKNVIPPVVKSAGTAYDEASLKAIAAVGTSQPFTAQITKTHGAKNLVFTDTMTNMSYNEDVAITVSAGTAPSATQAVVAKTDTGFTVTFDNAYIAGLADGTVITLKYSGTITSDALSANPATNKATLKSGDDPGNISESEEVKVYNAKFTVTKKDDKNQPLAGAGFVLQNADGAYYKLNAATDTAPATISWVTDIAQATEYTSDAQGAVTAFTGLANGTYTLVEKTVPGGYNKAADYTFTVSGTDYTTTNLEQATTVENKAGAELPATGGIGTTIFYVLGSLLVIGCGIVLVSRKRMENNK